MTKHSLILLVFTVLQSCIFENKPSENFTVGYNGALKNMMHERDISAKANLLDFKDIEHFYALGATEHLKGEIQILNSTPFNTSVRDSMLAFDNSFDTKATLLVYAIIPKWKSFNIPEEIKTYKQLEQYIFKTAEAHHLNIDKPFPFLIEGTPEYIDWHVINWKEGDMEHTHSKHINSGLKGRLRDTEVEMLGFYSNSHHAVFTHHTTNMHMHMVTVDQQVAGHVDDVNLNKGMVLKLPDY